jgi:hypothetical protein
MAENAGTSATGQQSLYPPTPDFYRLYREDADGTAERPLPPLPPQPVDETYQMFGEMHTVRHILVAAVVALIRGDVDCRGSQCAG